MPYEVILADIDNTLLDFTAGSRTALEKTLQWLEEPFTEERFQTYFSINAQLWEQYERGEIEKKDIYPTRFRLFSERFGIHTDAAAMNARYGDELRANVYLMPHCMEFLRAVHGKYKVYAITNGDTRTQQVRQKNSGIDAYIDRSFISEQMGCKKPDKRYFDLVFEAIGPVDKAKCILLGDSLTSDMQGGRNAGVTTCLLGQPTDDPRCDYVIRDLMDLLPILAQGKEHGPWDNGK